MNNSINCFYNSSVSLFQESFLHSLNTQKNKIFLIASVVFGCLAVCYVVRRCCFKVKLKRDQFGTFNGVGIRKYDQFILEGNFIDGKLNGQGKERILTVSFAEGEFKDGMLCGKGKITYDNGTILEGSFKKHKLNGIGSCTESNGTKFIGEFEDNVLVRGVYINFDGKKIQVQSLSL